MTYPLIKELGLEVISRGIDHVVMVQDLERLLSQGVRVHGCDTANDENLWTTTNSNGETHTGLLIGVKPLEKDSADGLLRETINELEFLKQQYNNFNPELLKRIHRHLEQK